MQRMSQSRELASLRSDERTGKELWQFKDWIRKACIVWVGGFTGIGQRRGRDRVGGVGRRVQLFSWGSRDGTQREYRNNWHTYLEPSVPTCRRPCDGLERTARTSAPSSGNGVACGRIPDSCSTAWGAVRTCASHRCATRRRRPCRYIRPRPRGRRTRRAARLRVWSGRQWFGGLSIGMTEWRRGRESGAQLNACPLARWYPRIPHHRCLPLRWKDKPGCR